MKIVQTTKIQFSGGGTGSRIAIVADDDPAYRRFLSRVIGGAVVEACSLDEVVTKAAEQQPAVVFLDVNWRGVGSSFDAIERIREAAPMTEIIMMTSAYNPGEETLAMAMGLDGYVEKGDPRMMRRLAMAARELARTGS